MKIRVAGACVSIVLAAIAAQGAQIHTSLAILDAIHFIHSDPYAYEIGASVSGVGDMDGDGFLDVAIGAPSYDPSGFGLEYRSGAIFILSGKQLQGSVREIDLADQQLLGCTLIGGVDQRLGGSMTAALDINGDGFDDFAFTSADGNHGYILFGRAAFKRVLPINEFGSYGIVIKNTGRNISSASDFNGDGYSDLIVGRPIDDPAKGDDQAIGRIAFIYGGASFPPDLDVLGTDPRVVSLHGAPGSGLGASVAGGFNLKLDGFADVFVLASRGGLENRGRALLIEGSNQPFELDENPLTIIEPVGRYIRNALDLNGDAHPDFIAGVDENEAWVILGRDNMAGAFTPEFMKQDPMSIHLKGAPELYGVGDLNGDGFNDLAAGLPNAPVGDKALAGRVVFLFGAPQWPKEIDIDQILAGTPCGLDCLIVDGLEEFGLFGASIRGVRDIQGDGFDDVIIGAPTFTNRAPDETLAARPGSAYLIQGKNIYFALQTQRSDFLSQGEDKK
ncbi:MAG: hypothetical protein GC154_16950 [bacterium]|nr:hypothetical protein [bacterium]